MNPTPASSPFSSTPNLNAAEMIQQELVAGGGDAATSGGGGRGDTTGDAVARAGAGMDGNATERPYEHFDERTCCNLVEQEKWLQLDDYLIQFLNEKGEHPASHPVLLLPVRRMIALNKLSTSVGDALIYFNSSIIALQKDASGLFIPLSGYVKREVDSIKDKLETNDGSTDFLDKEDFVECILDYVRLYFPEVMRHNQDNRNKKQEAIWNLTLVLRNEAGMPKKTKGKIHYRCLACGWLGGSTSGIKAQKVHVVGDKDRKPSCSMTTPRIYQLFEMQPPQPQEMKAPRIGQKRKRQSGTYQYDIQGHPGQSSSANPDLLLLDAVTSLSQEVSEPEPRQLNLQDRHDQELSIDDYLGFDTGYDIDFSLLDQFEPSKEFEPSKGFMDVVVVLNSRRSMSMLVDVLVRAIPNLEFVQKARESLQSILECCNDIKTLGGIRMVNAEVVMQSLAKMRGALSSVDCQLLVAEQVLSQFTDINREVDALEHKCLEAIHPPLPANHGQPHGAAPPVVVTCPSVDQGAQAASPK